MFKRLRTTGLAGAGAILLVASLSGIVAAGAYLPTARTSMEGVDPTVDPVVDPTVDAPVVDTTLTFEDVDGDGVDDDCQAVPAVEVDGAAAAADTAADLNGDGILSTSEAAQSARIGGKNCNHGGYVSQIAKAGHTCEAPTTPEVTDDADDAPVAIEVKASEGNEGEDEDTDESVDESDGDQGDQDVDEAKDDQDGEGDEDGDGAAPCTAEATADTAAHQAAKEARAAEHAADKAEREAAKAARKAQHDAAKAERAAERAAAKAAHKASKASHGKHGA